MAAFSLLIAAYIIQSVLSIDSDCNGGACTPLTVSEKQAILDLHNELRDRVAGGGMASEGQPAATNMNQLIWDDGLSAVAQAYAEGCPVFEHNDDADLQIVAQRDATPQNTKWGTKNGPTRDNNDGRGPFIFVGENLAGRTNTYTIDLILDQIETGWWDEYTIYTWNANQVGTCTPNAQHSSCGHYTQMAWSSTRYVGCGYVNGCGNDDTINPQQLNALFVCNYFPAGNFNSASTPLYEEATSPAEISSNCPSDRTANSSFYVSESNTAANYNGGNPFNALCGGGACSTQCDGESFSEATCNHCVDPNTLDFTDGTDGLNGGRNLQSSTTEPTTSEPTTANPTTAQPTTAEPTSAAPTTAAPTSSAPTTSEPTSSSPTTANPTTAEPSMSPSANPTTSNPTTSEPTTAQPTTANPTTSAPTTASPTTANPTTATPTTAEPTAHPSSDPTVNPTMATFNPTSASPTSDPSQNPTADPTSANPTSNPTADPSSDPTANPTFVPSQNPSQNPSANPTQNPSVSPSLNPTQPTSEPSLNPSADPTTANPTSNPSADPTSNPSSNPSSPPTTNNPTSNPSSDPTLKPSENPSMNPTTAVPTSAFPTTSPSLNPTLAPTPIPINITGTVGSVSGTVNDANSLTFVLSLATDYPQVNISTCSSTANQFDITLNVSDNSGTQIGYDTNSCPADPNQALITLTNVAAGEYTIVLGNLGGSPSNPLPTTVWYLNAIVATFSPSDAPTTSPTTSTTITPGSGSSDNSGSDSDSGSGSGSGSDSSDDANAAAPALNEDGANDLFGHKIAPADDDEYDLMLHFSIGTYYHIWGMLAVMIVLNLLFCLICRERAQKKKVQRDDEMYISDV